MSNYRIEIELADAKREPKNLQAETTELLEQLKRTIAVDRAGLVPVPAEDVPEGAKSIGGFLLGVLQAEVNRENAGKVLKFLWPRVANKTVKLKVEKTEGGGKRFEAEAGSAAEIEALLAAAKKYLDEG